MAPEADTPRHWLGTLLGPDAAALAGHPIPGVDAVAEAAIGEKVASLTLWRLNQLQSAGTSPDPSDTAQLRQRLAGAQQEDVLAAMVLEHEARALQQHLTRLQMPCLLLKGVALAHWAYEQPQHRRSNDIDLLVPTFADATRLAEHLTRHGYDWQSTSDSETGYELLCTRRIGPQLVMEVDIHWAVHVSPVFAGAMPIGALFADARPIPALGEGAKGLSPVDALLHASLNHALDVTNGLGEPLRLLHDFIAIGRHLDDRLWRQLVDQATAQRMAGAVCSALDATTRAMGATWPPEALARLRRAADQEPVDHRRYGDWLYMQRAVWRSLPGTKARLRWLLQRLTPNRGYLEHQHGTGHSYAGLLARRALSGLRKLWR